MSSEKGPLVFVQGRSMAGTSKRAAESRAHTAEELPSHAHGVTRAHPVLMDGVGSISDVRTCFDIPVILPGSVVADLAAPFADTARREEPTPLADGRAHSKKGLPSGRK